MANVTELSDDSFKAFIAENQVAVIDLWAPWCGPCKMIAPIVEELAGEMEDVAFAKLNIDEAKATAQEFGVMSIPTLLVLKEGQEVGRIVGALPKERIKQQIKASL